MSEHTIPVIDLWGRLIVSLQGDVTDSQMERLHVQILERIRDHDVDGLVLDVSGMWLMDSHLCAVLGRLVESARLMGVRAVLSGLSPQVVITLEEMGIDLGSVTTALSAEDALEKLGIRADENVENAADEESEVGNTAPAPSNEGRWT